MDRLQLHTQSQDTLQLLTQTRTMLQERLHLVEDGLLNHEMFRNTVRNGFQHGQEDLVTPPPAQNQNQQQNSPKLSKVCEQIDEKDDLFQNIFYLPHAFGLDELFA